MDGSTDLTGHAQTPQLVEGLPPDLTHQELAAMRAAGAQVLEWQRLLSKTQDNVVSEVLRHEPVFYVLDHYPKGDVYDPESHAQWYYHAHDQEDRPDEHGHFHLFLRGRGMPPEVSAGLIAKGESALNDLVCHLIAISMDPTGRPVKLFTTNRWVTGETWFAAEDVMAMLDHFDVEIGRPSWITNRWLSAMVALFRPQIVQLLHTRDAEIEAWRASHPDHNNVYEDRRLEVTSELCIDVESQVNAVTRRLTG